MVTVHTYAFPASQTSITYRKQPKSQPQPGEDPEDLGRARGICQVDVLVAEEYPLQHMELDLTMNTIRPCLETLKPYC